MSRELQLSPVNPKSRVTKSSTMARDVSLSTNAIDLSAGNSRATTTREQATFLNFSSIAKG